MCYDERKTGLIRLSIDAEKSGSVFNFVIYCHEEDKTVEERRNPNVEEDEKNRDDCDDYEEEKEEDASVHLVPFARITALWK